MIKKIVLLVFVLLVFVFFIGCHLDIKSDVDYPADLFKQTLKKIETIHAKDPGRKGPVTNLNILVYEGEDRQLISFSVPTATAKEVIKGVDLGKEEIKKYTKKIGDFELEKLGLLDRMGPGLILEAEVDEGNDMVHALIWLD
ncbi:MAG: hypothetical protein JSV88_29435 [Candidatus Aminicenantes bacterium]|nr:MAG: hypothetical protein JSV88_29435 [Candidatus Aminicenantes bacterium]